MAIEPLQHLVEHMIDHAALGVADKSWVQTQIDNIFDSGDTDDILEDQLLLDGNTLEDPLDIDSGDS